MSKLMLNATDAAKLKEMISSAENQYGTEYFYDPGFATYSCSCTAHKKSCQWD